MPRTKDGGDPTQPELSPGLIDSIILNSFIKSLSNTTVVLVGIFAT